jgi:hypothetical protein
MNQVKERTEKETEPTDHFLETTQIFSRSALDFLGGPLAMWETPGKNVPPGRGSPTGAAKNRPRFHILNNILVTSLLVVFLNLFGQH